MFNRILVPLDGSKLAESVLPFTCALAEQLQASLILFHVIEKRAPSEIHGERHLQEVSEAKTYLDEIAQKYSSAKVSITQDVHEVQEDGVAQTICDHAVELQTDLIALCTHGHGGIRDILVGSIAQQVVRQVTVPVLFIQPDSVKDAEVKPISQILLPLDGMKSHEAAIPIGAFLAKRFQAKVRLLTVIPTRRNLLGKEVVAGRYLPTAKRLTLDISAQEAENYLDSIAKDLSAQGLTVSDVVLRGEAAAKLIETVEAAGIDLVIMATHGLRAFDAQWEGSLTPKLFSETPVPIILVHVAKDEQE